MNFLPLNRNKGFGLSSPLASKPKAIARTKEVFTKDNSLDLERVILPWEEFRLPQGISYRGHIDGNTPTPNKDQDNVVHTKWEVKDAQNSTIPTWYFDSEAFNHMTNNTQLLTNIKQYYGNLKIHTADRNQLPIITYQVWHKRLGHPNSNALHDMLKSGPSQDNSLTIAPMQEPKSATLYHSSRIYYKLVESEETMGGLREAERRNLQYAE
ncbi:hypothetical protein CR513_03013, partial [Mucuna pruriens]